MLTARGVSFGFPGRVLLDNVSFEVRAGAATCLLGGNGSGKTTLFNIISGFLRPDSGSIRLNDTELVGRSPFRISRLGVSRAFQDLRLIGKLSVRENVSLAFRGNPGELLSRALFDSARRNQRAKEDFQRAELLLASFHLSKVSDELASEISYGQQKLLTLACCSAMEADVYLLDEPVAGISPEYREHIAEHLATLRTAGKTILFIEHQMDFLKRVGDQFLFLEAGRLYVFDNLTEMRTASVTHHAFT